MKDNKYTNELSVFAPYNFVGVSEKVNKKDRIQPHNVIDGNLLDGKIEYEIEALTPICVEDATHAVTVLPGRAWMVAPEYAPQRPSAS